MNKHLTCNYCHEIFKCAPTTLPCGWTVCSEHLKEQTMDCLICKNHEINLDNCVRATNIEIGLLEFQLKQNLQELKSTLKHLKTAQTDPVTYIYDYFSNLKNKIDLRKEEIIQSVNNHFEKLHLQIKEFEDHFKQDFQKSPLDDLDLGSYQTKIDLIESTANKVDVTKIRTDLNDVKYIDRELNHYLSSLTDYKMFTFEPKPIDANLENLFGQLRIQKTQDYFNVIGSSLEGSVTFWNVNIKNEFKEIKKIQAESSQICCFKLLANDKLVTGSEDGIVKIWDIKNGNRLKTFKASNTPVYCVEELNTNQIICGSNGKTLKVWNINDGTCSKTLKKDSGDVYCLKILPNNQLVSGSSDATIKLWNLSDGKCLKTLNGHTEYIWCFKYLNNMKLTSGSYDSTIKIWDLIQGICLKTLRGHNSLVRFLKMSLTGLLISGSDDATIKVWDVDTGVCVKTLRGHRSSIVSLTILPNDKLISCSTDQIIKIWCLRKGKCIKTMNISPTIIYQLKSYY